MIIEWIENIELSIFKEAEDIDPEIQEIPIGTIEEVDIFHTKKDNVSMQFKNNAVSFNIKKELFKILKK